MASAERQSDSPRAGSRGRLSDSRGTRWGVYQGGGLPQPTAEVASRWPPPPPWRSFGGAAVNPPPPDEEAESLRRLGQADSGRPYSADPDEVSAVNAALALRRPLLVTGPPGIGKSSLAYRISRELRLGRVLRWPVTSRATLRSGLYDYDAIGRAQQAGLREHWRRTAAAVAGRTKAGRIKAEEMTVGSDIGDYIQLGSLGTALLPYAMPRVLLIDELDKSDIDLPNDLLHVFEEGEYIIRELDRIRALVRQVVVHTADPGGTTTITDGQVRCYAFPVIVITSNGEREFPPAFLRRCLQLEMRAPTPEQLASIVAAQFAGLFPDQDTSSLITQFLSRRDGRHELGTDQLLNAVHLATSGAHTADESWQDLLDLVWRYLDHAQLP